MTPYELAFRALKKLPAEPTHEVVFGGLRGLSKVPGVRAALRELLGPKDPALVTHALGTTFAGPLGLAAGFDKDALAPEALFALGFGFVEIGTVTAQPQPGNPKPRLFRLPDDHALINRMGFNNRGAEHAARRLARVDRSACVVAVNIGKTKIVSEADAAADYAASAARLGPFARFVVVNVSSPNTPGLRDLQRVDALAPILDRVREALDRSVPERHVPLLVKLAPDLADDDIDAVADLALHRKLDGIVATNTTIRRDGLHTPAATVAALGNGGLSGRPLRERSLACIARLYRRTRGALTLIGAGGIADANDAWDRIAHGATLLELYTGFIYAGPLVARDIHAGLSQRLQRERIASLSELVGRAVRLEANVSQQITPA